MQGHCAGDNARSLQVFHGELAGPAFGLSLLKPTGAVLRFHEQGASHPSSESENTPNKSDSVQPLPLEAGALRVSQNAPHPLPAALGL